LPYDFIEEQMTEVKGARRRRTHLIDDLRKQKKVLEAKGGN
jgi:hypothetical protein